MLTNVPLDMKLVFNLNTNQVIIVSAQRASNGSYNFRLGKVQLTTRDPLLNNAGQVAGVNGSSCFGPFEINVGASPCASSSNLRPSALPRDRSAPGTTAGPAVDGGSWDEREDVLSLMSENILLTNCYHANVFSPC
ncbi:MAG: hypothetical protein P4L84_25315 [Isosphaeraceae bacterium]|nr:hypothetical protein [Isosphaeraceae bacterium]